MKYKMILSMALAVILSACSSQDQNNGNQMFDPGTRAHRKINHPDNKIRKNQARQDGMQIREEKPVKPSAPRVPGMRVASVSVPTKTVALTFDDGPHHSLTPRILDILAKYNSKGTFFALGSNVERYPSVARRVVAEGHEIANHSWDHPNLATTSRASASSQISRTNDAIIKATGVSPKLIRPPYGACNSSLIAWMRQDYGLTTVLWSVDTNDWRKPGVSTVISRAVNGARPGSIILVHDIHSSTADAIEGIVKGLKDRGYELVTVSELISRGAQYARQKKEEAVQMQPAMQPAAAPLIEAAPVQGAAMLPVSPAPSVPSPVPAPEVQVPVTVTTSSDSAD